MSPSQLLRASMSPTVSSAHTDPMPLSIAWLQLQLDCAIVDVAQVLTLQTRQVAVSHRRC
jgi:hypothetical protein